METVQQFVKEHPVGCAVGAGAALVGSAACALLKNPKPRTDGMQPTGGNALKNFLGECMYKRGMATKTSIETYEEVDTRQPDPMGQDSDGFYNDSWVFCGVDEEKHFFILRFGFRKEFVETWLLLTGDDCGHLLIEDYTTPANHNGTVVAGNIVCSQVVPGESWKITYDGPMKDTDTDETKDVKLSLMYCGTCQRYLGHKYFSTKAMGKALAENKWSKDFFERLGREGGADRLEQCGMLNGSIVIDGKQDIELHLRAVRDHSWGRRDWKYINKYMWNIFFFKKPIYINGHMITGGCFTIVHYGDTFHNLVGGWVAGPDTVMPLEECTDMKTVGTWARDFVIPEKYVLKFKAAGQVEPAEPFELEWTRMNRREHCWKLQDHNGDHVYNLSEAYADVVINGHETVGMAEFGWSPKPVVE